MASYKRYAKRKKQQDNSKAQKIMGAMKKVDKIMDNPKISVAMKNVNKLMDTCCQYKEDK